MGEGDLSEKFILLLSPRGKGFNSPGTEAYLSYRKFIIFSPLMNIYGKDNQLLKRKRNLLNGEFLNPATVGATAFSSPSGLGPCRCEKDSES